MKPCWICNLGLMPYDQALELQTRLAFLRYKKAIDDILLLLEHPPTVTLGKFGKIENVLVTEDELINRGISLCTSNRGGDVTFHCPGQLVVYPIMDMRSREGNLRRFLSELEEVVIKVTVAFGVPGERWSEHPGIWVEGRQIAAIGLHFVRGVSMHGISLNVNPDLEAFRVINLCGIAGKEATSIAKMAKKDVNIEQAVELVRESFPTVFEVQLEDISREQVLGDVIG
ncbi:MAG: lipoyl(octanoyl) transferase LipB [Dehalococcoidaceae bacterium]|nr:lipoyl(octanoyl) transferase LipB [Dehalococcoidaceae bacterium]